MPGGNRTGISIKAVLLVGGTLLVGVAAGLIVYGVTRGTASVNSPTISQTTPTKATVPGGTTTVPSGVTGEKRTTLTLMAGTEFETKAHIISSGGAPADNPVLFVLGGVHGDEPAARLSAERLLNANVDSGTLIVIPEANKVAARNGTRIGTKDLNRCFPGFAQGANEDRLAYEIFQLVQERKPSVVVTYHVSPGFHLQDPAMYGQTVIFDEPGTQARAQEVVNRINLGISVAEQRFSTLVEPIPTSATYEIYYRLGIPAYGMEVAAPLGERQGEQYQLMLTKIFCEQSGVRISNWDSVLDSNTTNKASTLPGR